MIHYIGKKLAICENCKAAREQLYANYHNKYFCIREAMSK
jgi:hypothetical protein